MLRNEFELLSVDEQVELIRNEAVFLLKRKENHILFLLFQFDVFYVEIAYKKYRREIQCINVFESTDQLDPYFKDWDVEEFIAKSGNDL